MQDGLIKVAACSPRIRVADVAHNVDACAQAIRAAADAGAKVVVLPELCVTGATCGDLFWQAELLVAARRALLQIAQATADLDVLAFVGVPLSVNASLYDCAVALSHGTVLGVVPKRHLSAAQRRQFAPAPDAVDWIELEQDDTVPFGCDQVFACEDMPNLVVAAEVGEDLWAPQPPSVALALGGATLVANLAAMPALVNSAAYARATIASLSARLLCGYVYACAGAGESTTDYVYGGQCLVVENGVMLAESAQFAQLTQLGAAQALTDIDIDALVGERMRQAAFEPDPSWATTPQSTPFSLEVVQTELTRPVDAAPFIPRDDAVRAERCEEILSIQAYALAERMRCIGSARAVVGISGGLDSTLALLVTARAFDVLGLERAGITAITMPGFGTTDRTHNNAWQLTLALGATPREIPIGAAVRQHFADIDHDEAVRNAAYENAQARERTQILMDVANDNGGIVVGTGDLSELALGWATYNGDHMSMYAVNAAVPKTLIRYIVRYVADTCGNERETEVLLDVLDTPVSPELLPANEDGTIAQQTEDLVGPYELHDFFVYHLLRFGSRPRKIYRLACVAFAGTYDKATIARWLKVFCRRFFSQQFKRSCAPDGPAIGGVGLSPRGGLAMPSDASSALWLAEVDAL